MGSKRRSRSSTRARRSPTNGPKTARIEELKKAKQWRKQGEGGSNSFYRKDGTQRDGQSDPFKKKRWLGVARSGVAERSLFGESPGRAVSTKQKQKENGQPSPL